MVFKLFYLTLHLFLLFWVLTLERVVGLPLAFLALSWMWVDRFPVQEQRKKQLLIFFLGCILALVYQESFFVGLLGVALGWFAGTNIQGSKFLFRWKWILFAFLGSLGLFFIGEYPWSVWVGVQLITSALLVGVFEKNFLQYIKYTQNY